MNLTRGFAVTLVTAVVACRGATAPPAPPATVTNMPAPAFGQADARALATAAERPATRASERDDIFMLLAFAVAYADWQDADQDARGHNVAAVLVDSDDTPVAWARNAVFAAGNLTQHAELRVMECYLAGHEDRDLEGFTLYVTLEPCAMCSGMALFGRVARVVFGQNDPEFGDAFERLALDRRSGSPYAPYPFETRSEASGLYHRYWLEAAFQDYRRHRQFARITEFLRTPEARVVFEDATSRLEHLRVKFDENDDVLERALAFYRHLPPETADCAGR